MHSRYKYHDIPNPSLPDITRSAFVQEITHLLQLASAGARIIKEVAQLAGIGLDLNVVFVMSRVAVEHQYLMLGPASLPNRVHWICLRDASIYRVRFVRWVQEAGDASARPCRIDVASMSSQMSH